jgi:hypothetical protein
VLSPVRTNSDKGGGAACYACGDSFVRPPVELPETAGLQEALMRARFVLLQVAVALLLVGTACKKSNESDTPVTEFVVGMSSFDTSNQAAQQSGQPPSASGGPTVAVSGNTNVVDGGSNSFQVTSNDPFQKVIVSVNTPAGAVASASTGFPQVSAGIAPGFFELTLPGPVTSEFVIVSFAGNIPVESFTLQFQAVSANGAVGTIATVQTAVVPEETSGSLQVTVTWDAAADVDLHLVEPNENEIFWAQPTSNTGGVLNVDSNPACFIDNINNENISYPNATPLTGEYIVRVDYFSSCSVERTNFVVTVNNNGQRNVFTGFFTGPGDFGADGAGREITRFTFTGNSAPSLRAPIFRRPGFEPSPEKIRIIRNRRGR